MQKTLFVSALCAISLSSCLLGPDFEGTKAELPATWVNKMPPATTEQNLSEWWAAFNDKQLSALIETAFANNPDMINAVLSIDRAEAEVRSVRAGLLPSGSVGLGGNNSGSFDTSTL